MITGYVRRREAVVPIEIAGARGRRVEVSAVIDTGYTGWLTLPPHLIAELRLRWHSMGRGMMADGRIAVYDVYVGRVFWNGKLRRVRVNMLDGTPLVGMSLLRGYELKMEVRYRGSVTIQRMD